MRCIRSVKSLRAQEGSGISAVALYTDVDRDAPFVRHADLAVELPVTEGLPILSLVAAILGVGIVADCIHQHELNRIEMEL